MWYGLPDDLATLVTDFCVTDSIQSQLQRRQFKYAWIHKDDGRTGKDFKSLEWWSKLDHLQYTLKICQGIDFNPPEAHYGIGFCYTTPNTAVPRRILQQEGRIRRYADNPIREHPTVFFAVGERVNVKRLHICGYKQLESFAKEQESFMGAVAKHHSRSPDYFSWFFEPSPVWRKLYLMVMNERETFLMYPKASYEWWLRHDNWTVSELTSKPKPMLRWKTQTFMERAEILYEDIGLLDELEYHYLRKRRNRTKMQVLQVSKYHFHKTFDLADADIPVMWKLFTEHQAWVHNTQMERFSDCENVIQRRWGKLLQTQRNTEWLDMAAARLVIIQKLTRRLGLPELWNANGKTINPEAFGKAEKWVELNQKQIRRRLVQNEL